METENDIAFILRAASFAADKHRNQRRKDAAASPYINHPLSLAAILADEGGVTDPAILAAALLHDTVEDTETTIDELETLFGNNVAAIVAEVTDDKTLDKAERKRLQVEKAATKSAGAKLVKLADKISNLRDIADCPPTNWSDERRSEYVSWAIEVVAGLRGVHPGLEGVFDGIAQKLSSNALTDAQRRVMAKVFDFQAEHTGDLAERAYKRTMAAKLRLMTPREPLPTLTKLQMDKPDESLVHRADLHRSDAVDALGRADRAESEVAWVSARQAFDVAIAALVEMGLDKEAEVKEAHKRAGMGYEKKLLQSVENKAPYSAVAMIEKSSQYVVSNQESSFEIARQEGSDFRSVLVELHVDGSLRVSGQDLGPGTRLVSDDGEYEFWVDVAREAVQKLAAVLIRDRFQGDLDAVSKFEDVCIASGVPHRFWTW